MQLVPTRTSIGAKLALRFGAILLAALSLFAFSVGSLVEERINAEARLVLRVQFADLLDGYEAAVADAGVGKARDWVAERARNRVLSADPSLGLGVALRNRSASVLFAAGSLNGTTAPLDQRLRDGERLETLRAINLGEDFAFLSLAAPVTDGFLQVVVSTERFANNAADVRKIFMWSVPALLAFAGLAGWYLSRRALAPITDMTRAARDIGSNAEGWIPTNGTGDELDQLADTLNGMIEGIRSGVERVRRFSSNAAHELRSPLGRIHHHLDQLEKRAHSGSDAPEVAGIRDEIETMNGRIESLLRLARFEQGLREGQAKVIDLGALASEVGSFFEADAEEREIRFDVQIEGEIHVIGDHSWLVSAVSNLVSNALKHGRAGDRVTIRMTGDREMARLDVIDTGPGLDESATTSIFERFERAAAHRVPGSGLGLAIAQEVARAHGGEIELSTKPGHGSTFSLVLPCAVTNPSDTETAGADE